MNGHDAPGCRDRQGFDPGDVTNDRENPPAQNAIRYRAGTHADFTARMLARIHRATIPDGPAAGQRPLARLTTRALEDPAIALIDAGATILDVLTFYQERIANEGFLHTATERRSVLELARAIGYELRPGLAAETFLAFQVDDADGTPRTAHVPGGTQVMSIPARDGELPQTFETTEDLDARAEWNTLRPRRVLPQRVDEETSRLYLAGTATGLAPGDLLLLVAEGAPRWLEVHTVETDSSAGHTRVDVAESPAKPTPPSGSLDRGKLDPNQEKLPLTRENVRDHIFTKLWNEVDLQAFLSWHGWPLADVLGHIDALREATFHASLPGLLALRERVGFFGHNAPRQELLPSNTAVRGRIFEKAWDGSEPSTIWQDSGGNVLSDADVFLERPVPGVVEGSWVVFSVRGGAGFIRQAYRVTQAFETSRSDYGISARVQALRLEPEETKHADFLTRTTTAYVRSEPLALAALPIVDDLVPGQTELWLDGMRPGLHPGKLMIVAGEEPGTADRWRTEVVTLSRVEHHGGYTRLVFESGLRHGYRRRTVELSGNVARASHGETVAGEVLGSGDGRATNQRFTLTRGPLSYLSARTPTGARSTLTVRVDGVEWQPVRTLYGHGPTERVYTVRHDDEGRATVHFGGGPSGARLPTGVENVTATYRTGTGMEGEVGADALRLLKTRPFGVRDVTNPLPATGAEDPESLDEARRNAPLTVLTLDRIVSLRDYEDFARAFAGVGKIRAASVWNGETEVVHLTVTSAGGGPVVEPLYDNLLAAIDRARDPLRKVELASFQPLYFFVEARLLIEPAFDRGEVEAAVRAALNETFGFSKRQFAHPVTAAEVVAAIHGVAGVVAVDLDALYGMAPDAAPPPSGSRLNAVLEARPARYEAESGRILPAELLLIHELGITLTPMTA